MRSVDDTLNALQDELRIVESSLAEPDVASDLTRLRDLSRRHKELSEINVACESCHGAGSQHLAWAKQAKPPTSDDNKGLAAKLHSDWQTAWKFADANSPVAHRDQPAKDELMNTCWACHARRLTLIEGNPPSTPLENTHKPALLTQPTYHADGQQRDEDYTWFMLRWG